MNERFQGIVLFKRPHRENDALVKIFTQEYGTKMFFIRGLEKVNFKYKGQFLPLSLNEYVGTINQEGLSFISEAKTLNTYRAIQYDIEKQAYGAYLSQLVDAAIEDNLKDEGLYDTFKNALDFLNQKEYPEILISYIEIYLLKYFGVHLNLTHCAVCGRSDLAMDLSLRRNGVLCSQHWQEDPYRLHIHPRAVYIAGILSGIQLDQINQIHLKTETLTELRRMMDEIYQEYVGIRLKSKSYLDQLKDFQKQFDLE